MARIVLVIKHGAFGDIVQADGVLRDIRNHYRDARILLLTTSALSELMTRSPYIDEVLIDDRAPFWQWKRHVDLFSMLSQHAIDTVIDLQNSTRSHWYRRLGLKHGKWLYRSGKLTQCSALRGLQSQLVDANIPVRYALSPDVTWMADDVTDLLKRNQVNQPYIALIPGSSAKHTEKRWPYYADLASLLITAGYEVVTILGPDELSLAASIPGHHLAKKHALTWFELAGMLRGALFVIGNDTGPSHVASCLNRPGLALFGPTTSAQQAEIVRGDFDALSVTDLRSLSAETVFNRVIAAVK